MGYRMMEILMLVVKCTYIHKMLVGGVPLRLQLTASLLFRNTVDGNVLGFHTSAYCTDNIEHCFAMACVAWLLNHSIRRVCYRSP